MPKPHKIKKYSQKTGHHAARRRKKRLKAVLFGLFLVALVFVGVSAYPAVKNYFDGKVLPTPIPAVESSPKPLESSKVESVAPEALPPEETTIESIAGKILPYETALNPQLLKEFLGGLPKATNLVLFRTKDSLGKVFFTTENPSANQWQAVVGSVDIKALADAIEAAGYEFGVIQSVFSDPIAAKGDLESNAIMHSSGVIWLDNSLDRGGKPWVTPYSQSARQYNVELAQEAVENGATVVLFEYMRFPNDVTNSGNVKAAGDISRGQVLELFYQEALKSLGENVIVAPVTFRAEAEQALGNEQLYGVEPMTLAIPTWAVDLEGDGAESDAPLNLSSEKRFILLIEENQQGEIGKAEYILK